MKYDGTFYETEHYKLREYTHRLDFFFFDQKPMETYLFKSYKEMIHFIATKVHFVFEDMYILEKIETTYRPCYEITERICWNDFK